MQREEGFYWVRTTMWEKWTVAEWSDERFHLTGSDAGWYPEEMEEIGCRIEPKKVAAYIEPSTPTVSQ